MAQPKQPKQRKQPKDNEGVWIRLSPSLVEALQTLAQKDELTIESLIVQLVNEGLAHRLHRNRW